jgi:preprotein translocase subunit SecE
VADDKLAKAPRRVRSAETVREKAEKAVTDDAKPRRGRQLWRGFTAPIRLIGRAIAKVGRFLGRFVIFRFIGRVLVPRYFRNSWKELRQVTWPTRRESRQLTTAVVLFATIFGLLIAVVDYGLDKIFKQVLLK